MVTASTNIALALIDVLIGGCVIVALYLLGWAVVRITRRGTRRRQP